MRYPLTVPQSVDPQQCHQSPIDHMQVMALGLHLSGLLLFLQPSLSMPLLHASPEGKALLCYALDQITASGGTDILAAASLATDQLMRVPSPPTSAAAAQPQQQAGYMKTLLLVTDREQARSSKDHTAVAALLASNGIRLHAVGIGEGHDSHFLTGLTRAAGGSYCPVQTLEQQSGTAGAFLGGCASAVAFNAVVELHEMSGASTGRERVEEPREQPDGRIRRRSTRKRGYSLLIKAEDARAGLQAELLKEEGEEAGDRALAEEEEDAARGKKRVRGIVTQSQGGEAQWYRAQRTMLEGEQAEEALEQAPPAGRQIKRLAGDTLGRVAEEEGAPFACSIKQELEAPFGEQIKDEPGVGAQPKELAQLVEVLGGENAGLMACCTAAQSVFLTLHFASWQPMNQSCNIDVQQVLGKRKTEIAGRLSFQFSWQLASSTTV